MLVCAVPQAIRNYVSGVKHLHNVLYYEFPYSGNLLLKLVFRSIERLNHMSLNEHLQFLHIISHRSPRKLIGPICKRVLSRLFPSFFSWPWHVLETHYILVTSPFFQSLCPSDPSISFFGVLVTFWHTKTIQLDKGSLVVPLVCVEDQSVK